MPRNEPDNKPIHFEKLQREVHILRQIAIKIAESKGTVSVIDLEDALAAHGIKAADVRNSFRYVFNAKRTFQPTGDYVYRDGVLSDYKAKVWRLRKDGKERK